MAAEAAISSAVQTLGNLLIQKVNFLRGVEGEVRWLRDELKRMQCFLKDAAEKQANNESVRNWISEFRELAQDAEDTIEIFVLKVESKGLLGRFASFPKHMYHLNKVGKEIESIRERLEAIDKSRERYGIKDLGDQGVDPTTSRRSSENVERQRRLAPGEKDKDMVGLEDDVKLLLQKAILEERDGLSIATIVGMGGIGKSTLARKIYNHTTVASRFECRAWVVVSSEFTPDDIIKQIMLQLQNSEEDRQKLLKATKELQDSINDKLRLQEMLQDMLHKELEGKQYFIVLDDVWKETDWTTLKRAFPDEQEKSSRLVITSRNRVPTSARFVHEMQVLDEVKSWELFLKKAFPYTNSGKCPDQDMENIGRQILERCGGLPLAITVVGGLLANQRQSRSEWEKVLKGMDSHLRQSEHNVFGILELSYLNLSPQLKSCFLCLGFFKEDTTIRAKKLVNIWIAEGLVPEEEGSKGTMEEIGRSCLDELVSRNLIQVKEMTMEDGVKSCYMHDLLHKLSMTKAKEEISLEILSADDQGNSRSLHKPRHLGVYYYSKRFRQSKHQHKYLRSVLFYGNDLVDSPSDWKSFELLRILDFEDTYLYSFPNAIGGLISLRYLGLRNTSMHKLPRSLGRLKKLEVLDVSENGHVELRNFIWKLEGLRHLYVDGIESKAPLKIDTLKNIQTLSYVSVRSLVLEHVAQLTSLRKLGIIVEGDSDVSKICNSLAKLEHFVSLTLKVPPWLSFIGHREVDSWAFFHGFGFLHRLTKLKLCVIYSRKFIRLPSASDFPPNLSHLVLAHMVLNEDSMVILEKLPQLSYLKLDNIDGLIGKMVISHARFPKLRVLVLRFMWHSFWKHIKVQRDATQLKRLEFHKCEVTPQIIREELKIETDVDIFCYD